MLVSPQVLKELGYRLKKARTDKGLTQAELAKLTGISENIIVTTERGKRPYVTFAIIYKWSSYLGLDLKLQEKK